MKTKIYTYQQDWNESFDDSMDSASTLILLFSSLGSLELEPALVNLYDAYPNSSIIGCSTSGEIYQDEIYDHSISVIVIQLEKTTIALSCVLVDYLTDIHKVGKELVSTLPEKNLKHIFVLSGGWDIDGTELTDGISIALPPGVSVTGGVAGDDAGKLQSWVLHQKTIGHNRVVAVAFYGEHIHIGSGCQAGWDKLGLDRKVTRSQDKKLFTLDDKPALGIYKQYLGKKAYELPGSALLFPLAILDQRGDAIKIRSVTNIDETDQSLLLNDSIPEGTIVSLMSANFNRLVDGVYSAAVEANCSLPQYHGQSAAIAISCIGRRRMMLQRTEEELSAVREGLDSQSKMVGFYSNGEISTSAQTVCSLHNQTMTLTVIKEL